ncbi:MAG: hypothetical protein WBZ36_23200 [Candidatus Nitrosopolaris sp.]|jgi:hypothetical protein
MRFFFIPFISMYLCHKLKLIPMTGRSQEEAQKNRETCISILAVSSKIRYAAKMNMFGRTLAGQLRKGVVPLFKPDEARNENFIEATRNQLRKGFEPSIGKTKFTLTENENVKILTLPNRESFYYVTLDKDTMPEEIYEIIASIRALVIEENK